MNRKLRRKLAKHGEDYIEKLAVDSVNREISQSAENLFDQNLALATKFVLSSVVLAIDKTHRWSKTGYEKMLTKFAETYSELITSGDPEKYISMAEDICGQEMTFVFTHDEFDPRQIGSSVEMYINGTWRRGEICEGLEGNVTMRTKDGRIYWCDIGSDLYRKPILAES